MSMILEAVRCYFCKRKLFEATRPLMVLEIICERCGRLNRFKPTAEAPRGPDRQD